MIPSGPRWPKKGSDNPRRIESATECQERGNDFDEKKQSNSRLGPRWPIWPPVGSKIAQDGIRWPKMAQDGPKLAQDSPKLTPRWPRYGPRWPMIAPSWAQDGPRWNKMAKDGTRCSQDGPKMAKDDPKLTSERSVCPLPALQSRPKRFRDGPAV